MSREQSFPIPPNPNFSLSIPIETLRPLIASILESTGPVSGWPTGRIALNESEAAECIGVKAHVLRDARLRLKLAHSQVGRTVTYTAGHLSNALTQMAANS